jgi:hypothetical protein
MRKTILLAIATLMLAFASLATDLIRADAGVKAVVTPPAPPLQATNVAKIQTIDSI